MNAKLYAFIVVISTQVIALAVVVRIILR